MQKKCSLYLYFVIEFKFSGYSNDEKNFNHFLLIHIPNFKYTIKKCTGTRSFNKAWSSDKIGAKN